MKSLCGKVVLLGCLAGVLLVGAGGAAAASPVPPFTNLATGFTQELVASMPAGQSATSGYAFDSQGNVYTDSLSNGHLYKIDMSTTVPQPGGVGTMHPVTDLGPLTYRSGPRTGQTTYGGNFTQYPDGSVYLNSWTGLGVVKVDLATATIESDPIPNAPGGNWGIYVDPQLDSYGNHEIWYQCGAICVIDPVAHKYIGQIPIGTDGMAIDSTGNYLFTTGGMQVWHRVAPNPSNPDLPVFQFVQNAGGNADGMSFATIGDQQVIVTNDGSNHTVSEYTFPNNDFSKPATRTTIASGNIGQYGDQANVGPDGYFYITQWYGTRFGDGSTSGSAAIVRIGPGGRFLPPTHSDNLSLSPTTDTVASGGTEDLTATLVTTDLTTHQTVPVAGTSVTFTVVAGPDTGATSTVVTDANGHADYTLANTNGVGDDVVHAQYVDANGQTQTSNNAVISFIVPPSPPTVTPTVTGTLGSNGWYTSDVSVHWTVADATATSGCDDASVTSDTSTVGTTFTCTATNDAGPTTQSVTILRDATAPTVSAVATSDPNANGWYNHDVTVHFTCSDGAGGSGIPDGACPADQTLTSSGSSVPVTVTDAAGNTSDPSNVVTVQIDRVAPTVTVPADQTVEATGPNGAIVNYSGASAADTVDNASPVSCLPASGSTFALGKTTVTCSSTDDAGNTGTATFAVNVVDTTPPTVTVPADKTVEATGPNGATVNYSGASATDLVDGTDPVTCSPSSGSTFALGKTTVTCSSTDDAGNTGTATFSVNVVDTTPPTVTVPADKTVEATGPNGAIVNYSGASATDLVDGTDPVTCSPSSGSTFALGKTTVTCSSTDAHGNTGTATFTVKVVDTTPPTLTLPANIVVDAASPAGKAVTYSVSATDIVDGATAVTCSPASGSTFAIGTTTVTCSSTDAHGNTASGTFTVHVRSAAEMTSNLCSAVQGVVPGTSLYDKCTTAASYIAKGDRPDAIATLKAFNQEVAAQRGKKLTAAQADSYTASANAIIAVLGG